MARKTPSVVLAVRRELRELEKKKAAISKSADAAAALAMARELDDPENTASGKASCARVLDQMMAAIRLSARHRDQPPPETGKTEDKDTVAQIADRRARRRTGT